MVEQVENNAILNLEREEGIIRHPFFREIILNDQVVEAVNNIRRAFRFAEERLSDRINLKVQVFLLGVEISEKKDFDMIDRHKINIKVCIQGENESAAEFLKEWGRIWIWWYKGYENVDPVEYFIKTAAECGTPKDWWKVKGFAETVEELTKESAKSDALELLELLKAKNLAFSELKRGIPCPLTGNICPVELKNDPYLVFIAMPIRPEYEDVFKNIESVLLESNLRAWIAQREPRRGHILCKICEKIQTSNLGIFEITELSPNVMLELGLSYGLGKSIILITRSIEKVPSDLRGLEVIEYRNLGELERQLRPYLNASKSTN